jgi:hypothetical protein
VTVGTATDTGGSGADATTIIVERDSAPLVNGTCGTFTGTWTTVVLTGGNDPNAPTGSCYRYRVRESDNVDNEGTSGVSNAAKVDATGPANTLTLSGVAGSTFISGTTVFTNPQSGLTGGFTVTSAATDAESGVQNVSFPSLGAGYSGGGTDTTSPYTGTYTWSGSSATSSGPKSVTATNGAGGQTTSTFTVTPDTTPPSVPTPTVANGYVGSTTLPVTLGAATDSGSGLNAATLVLQRDTVALNGGQCSFTSTWTTVTLSGGNDTLTNGNCYRYRQIQSDNVGNQTTSGTSNTVKIDTTVPTLVSVAASNGNTPGTISSAGGQDALTFTYGDTNGVDPASIVGGWSGSGSQSVSVTFTDGGASANDTMTIPGLGVVDLGSKNWLTSSSTRTETLSQSAANVFVLRISSDPSGLGTNVPASTFTWSAVAPSSAKDYAGNGVSGSVAATNQRF